DAKTNEFMSKRLSGLFTASAIAIALIIAIAVTRFDMRSIKAGAFENRLAAFPKIVLWAWERPEMLDFIDNSDVGVAFLARTIYLRGGDVIVRPRLQPLSFPDGTALMAVARIESDRAASPALTADQLDKTASMIAALAQIPKVKAVQIDFDAAESERPFYRKLLLDLRRRLPGSTALSITALASWCVHDDW